MIWLLFLFSVYGIRDLQNSDGILGDGIEQVEDGVISLGDQLNEKFSAQDDRINADAQITSATVVALCRDRIVELEDELEEVQHEIVELEAILGDWAYDTSF